MLCCCYSLLFYDGDLSPQNISYLLPLRGCIYSPQLRLIPGQDFPFLISCTVYAKFTEEVFKV